MTHSPPLDQRIVDEFFQLDSHRGTKEIAWLYGMVATYGLTPDQLNTGYTWEGSNLILSGKKRPIRPLHPQWVFLFQLKEKQPRKVRSCWKSLCTSLYRAMAHQEISSNITDLVLAHKIRKSHYQKIKQQQPVYAVAF